MKVVKIPLVVHSHSHTHPVSRLSDDPFVTCDDNLSTNTSTPTSLKKQDSIESGGYKRNSKSLPVRNDGTLDYDGLLINSEWFMLDSRDSCFIRSNLRGRVRQRFINGIARICRHASSFSGENWHGLDESCAADVYSRAPFAVGDVRGLFCSPGSFVWRQKCLRKIEKINNFFFSVRIADLKDPRERMVQVVRWYLSAYHAGRKSTVAKKPYNPIIGEVFRCHWNMPEFGEKITSNFEITKN